MHLLKCHLFHKLHTMIEDLHRCNREKIADHFREHPRDCEKNDTDASKPVARHFKLSSHSHHNMAIWGLSLHHGNTESLKILENATPGSIKKATKYGMKIFQNLKTLFWEFTVNALHAWTLGDVRFQYSGEWFVNEFDWHAFATRLKYKNHVSNNRIIRWRFRAQTIENGGNSFKDKDWGQQRRSCVCWANTTLFKQNA